MFAKQQFANKFTGSNLNMENVNAGEYRDLNIHSTFLRF